MNLSSIQAPQKPATVLFLPTKGQVFQANTERMFCTFEITKTDQKIHVNRRKQVHPKTHGSRFPGGPHLAGALCLFKLLFHSRFNVCNFRVADMKFTGLLNSFHFQCFRSETGSSGCERASKERGPFPHPTPPAVGKSVKNRQRAEKTRCSTVAQKGVSAILHRLLCHVFSIPAACPSQQHLSSACCFVVRFRA